jgi:hypothetical protein
MNSSEDSDKFVPTMRVDTEATAKLRKRREDHRASLFVMAKLPLEVLKKAAHAHPRGVELLLVAKMQSDLQRGGSVRLSAALLEEVGLRRETRRRAINALKAAGLIEIRERRRGCLPVIHLLPWPVPTKTNH